MNPREHWPVLLYSKAYKHVPHILNLDYLFYKISFRFVKNPLLKFQFDKTFIHNFNTWTQVDFK